jgi:hypothetical protein
MLLAVFCAFLISGCASTVVKPEFDPKISRVVIIPVVEEFRGYSSQTVGGVFGLLGVAIEHAATRTTAEAVAGIYRENIREDHLRRQINNKVALALSKQYPGAVIEARETKMASSKGFSEWFASPAAEAVADAKSNTIIVETGYANEIFRDLGGVVATGWVAIKYVDPSSNSVVGKSAANSLLRKNAIKIFGSEEAFSEEKLAATISQRFHDLHERLIGVALNEISK